jgi:dTDP-4-amino-4,6-dideoxygalactose transaminase
MESFLPFGRPDFTDREIDAVARVMRSGWVGMGPETIAFEQELAAAMQAPQVVCVNACTSALLLSLRVLGVGPGDEVVCPSLTWCSTANVALHLGARPVFCDIDPLTLCVTPATVLQAVGERTRAVIPVHLGGRAVDIAALRAALPPQVQVVEDAAHALGATLPGGAPVGASGALTCFSFYANKAVSTGDGGAIAVHDAETADRLRSLRLHGLGLDAWQRHGSPRDAMAASPLAVLGYKANYTDLQAAIGRVQLARQAEFAERRVATAQVYAQGLPALGLGLQAGLLDPGHARHLFIAVLPPALRTRRAEVLTALREHGIGATVHYPPLHHMPLYAVGDATEGAAPSLPHTDAIADRILTLPIGASVGPADAQRVLATLGQIIDRLPARQPS